MRRSLLLLLAATTFLCACDGTDRPTEGARPAASGTPRAEGSIRPWEAPPNYSFRVRSRCGEQNFIGTFHIVVRNGAVSDAKGLDGSGAAALRHMDEVPTLTDLLDYAVVAREADAEVAEVDYDKSDGHPKKIDIDYDTNAIDDESCFVVTDYRA
jgi:hypothetical protein